MWKAKPVAVLRENTNFQDVTDFKYIPAPTLSVTENGENQAHSSSGIALPEGPACNRKPR
jgi:hypothetical protein